MSRWTVMEDVFMLHLRCQSVSHNNCMKLLDAKFDIKRSGSGFFSRITLLKNNFPQIWESTAKS